MISLPPVKVHSFGSRGPTPPPLTTPSPLILLQPCGLAISDNVSHWRRSSTHRRCLLRALRVAQTQLYSCTTSSREHGGLRQKFILNKKPSVRLQTLILLEFPSGEKSFLPSSISTSAFQSFPAIASRSPSSDMIVRARKVGGVTIGVYQPRLLT